MKRWNKQRKIDKATIIIPKKTPRKVVVLMDTTYFVRVFGVMLFKDTYTKEYTKIVQPFNLLDLQLVNIYKTLIEYQEKF